jgi:hypothetical protein
VLLVGGLGILIDGATHYRAELDPTLDRGALLRLEDALVAAVSDPDHRARVETLRSEARGVSLEGKARVLAGRIEETERAHPTWLLPLRYRAGEPVRVGEIETTCHYLAALAFEYRVTRNPALAARARLVVADIMRMDAANGRDGYLPKEVRVRGGALEVHDDETHANVYAQLFFAYTCAFRYFEDASLRALIREHVDLVVGRLLETGFVVRNAAGEQQPQGDLTPKRFRFKRGRCLGGLLICDAGIMILGDVGAHRERVAALSEQRRVFLEEYRYDDQIQRLHFKLGPVQWPSPSSVWLNFQKLYALHLVDARAPYRRALARQWASEKGELNPLQTIMALEWLVDVPAEERRLLEEVIEYYLETFPLTHSYREMSSRDNPAVRLRSPARYVKLRRQREATVPLPVFMRPLRGHEWKRRQARVEGHVEGNSAVHAPGTDYLLAYWMYRSYRGERLGAKVPLRR